MNLSLTLAHRGREHATKASVPCSLMACHDDAFSRPRVGDVKGLAKRNATA